MLVDKAQAAQGSAPERKDVNDRLVNASRQALRIATPSNLDEDLPGRSVAHGFNIGLTPVLFAAIGYGIDRALGTLPVFTVALTVLCVVGMLARFYYAYKATVEAEAASHKGRAEGQGSRHR